MSGTRTEAETFALAEKLNTVGKTLDGSIKLTALIRDQRRVLNQNPNESLTEWEKLLKQLKLDYSSVACHGVTLRSGKV